MWLRGGVVGRNAVEGRRHVCRSSIAERRNYRSQNATRPLKGRQTSNHRSQTAPRLTSVGYTDRCREEAHRERTNGEKRVVRVTVVHVHAHVMYMLKHVEYMLKSHDRDVARPSGAEAAKENPCAPAMQIRRGRVGGLTPSVGSA